MFGQQAMAPALAAAALTAALVAVLVAGCGGAPEDAAAARGGTSQGTAPQGTAPQGTASQGPASQGPASQGPAAQGPAAGFNATDVAWLQLADALHGRALPMLALAADRSEDRALAALAGRMAEEHEAERGRLRTLLARTGVDGGANPHAGHDMPGMPTAADLRALERARGGDFDRRFVPLLRAYLRQLVLVAEGEQRSGESAEARRLAAATARAHTAELARLPDGPGKGAGG
ncbi:DUF305 domain-containing protein [Nonomuraea sp. NPDC050783]|uniref:DUF305 domain-containing protein n=1 Tax=Nonomuraea sp. NPDC050783 TaxID=3154634 RepID=UPI0034674338